MQIKIKNFKSPKFKINDLIGHTKIKDYKVKILQIYNYKELDDIIDSYNKNPLFSFTSAETKQWIKNLSNVGIVYLVNLQQFFFKNTFTAEKEEFFKLNL